MRRFGKTTERHRDRQSRGLETGILRAAVRRQRDREAEETA